MLHADHLWVWEQIILLALPQCMDNCTGNNGAVPAGGPAGPCCMPITGRYGTRMFFSRFHNAWIAAIFANTRYGSRMFFWCFQIAWLTVSEASVQCPPANRPADASCRSLVGMGAECSSRVSTMHGQLSRKHLCSSRRSTSRRQTRSTAPKKSKFENRISKLIF